MKKHSVTFVIMTLVIMTSCELDVKQLSPEEKYTVDTFFSNRLNDYIRYSDSLCRGMKDTLFTAYADSIKIERIKEIESLLNIQPERQ